MNRTTEETAWSKQSFDKMINIKNSIPFVQCEIDWTKVLWSTWHKIAHSGYVLPSQSFGTVLKKLNLAEQKQATQEQNSLS